MKKTAYSSDIGDQLKNCKEKAYYKQLAYVKFYKLTLKFNFQQYQILIRNLRFFLLLQKMVNKIQYTFYQEKSKRSCKVKIKIVI